MYFFGRMTNIVRSSNHQNKRNESVISKQKELMCQVSDSLRGSESERNKHLRKVFNQTERQIRSAPSYKSHIKRMQKPSLVPVTLEHAHTCANRAPSVLLTLVVSAPKTASLQQKYLSRFSPGWKQNPGINYPVMTPTAHLLFTLRQQFYGASCVVFLKGSEAGCHKLTVKT